MDLKVSLNWLKEYVQIDVPLKDFVKEFSLRSQSIERVHVIGPTFSTVVTAKILAIKPHPNADKLRLATVTTGQDHIEVVCGAPNIEVNQIVPLARIGALLKDTAGQTLEIKKATIRGIESNGMLCSPRELGLSDDHAGILILPLDTPLGKPLEKVLPLKDYLLDIEVTSNRPDAMSVVGLAREAAAVLGKKFSSTISAKIKPTVVLPLQVSVSDAALCRRYQAIVMDGVTIGPSPLWLQLRLYRAGLRPINNVVDITNYVLLEYGQPLHVFDYDKLSGKKIIVRKAKNGEKILALDGKTYALNANQLVIADEKNPIAIAGVMGGEHSAASTGTKTIVFESANFDPYSVRKTARALNVHSDSSNLFEKGLPIGSTTPALLRAVELTQKIAGGRVSSNVFDISVKQATAPKIKVTLHDVQRYLGIIIPPTQIKNILTRLGFAVTGSTTLTVTAPWWRGTDVAAVHDVIEEIARMYGYYNLPTRLPAGMLPSSVDSVLVWEDHAKDILGGLGFMEVYNYSMTSADLLEKVKMSPEKAIKISNPLNTDLEYLRTSLIPGLLQNVASNGKASESLALFELSHVYIPTDTAALPDEQMKLTGVVVERDLNSFYTLKGVVEVLRRKLGLNHCVFVPPDFQSALWEKDMVLQVMDGSKLIGRFGIVRRDITERFGISKPVGLFDFDFRLMSEAASTIHQFESLPEFPASNRDISMILDEKVTWDSITHEIQNLSPLIVSIKFLDMYSGQSIEKGKKSLALRLELRASDHTLTTAEIDQALTGVHATLQKKFHAIIR